MSDNIWEATLDGKYLCTVTRIDEYTGQLKVQDGDNLMLDETVGLSFGAIFGPDTGDVQDWQEKCINVIDRDD